MNTLTLFDSIFDDMMGMQPSVYHSNFNAPRVDVKSDNNGYTLEMDLPGRSEADVNIELDHNTLTISSKTEETKESKKEAKEEAKTNWILKERRVSEFSRKFTLPEDVNGEEISANFKNGVLTVAMPRKELAAPKRIAIQAA